LAAFDLTTEASSGGAIAPFNLIARLMTDDVPTPSRIDCLGWLIQILYEALE